MDQAADNLSSLDGENRAAFSIETLANVLQNFLSLVHDCCGTFANCFDTERSPVEALALYAMPH